MPNHGRTRESLALDGQLVSLSQQLRAAVDGSGAVLIFDSLSDKLVNSFGGDLDAATIAEAFPDGLEMGLELRAVLAP